MFGLGNKKIRELEKQIAYLTGQLEMLTQIKNQPPPPDQEPEEPKTKFERLNQKLDKISWAMVERRLKALEKRLYPKEDGESHELTDETFANNPNPDSLDIPTLVKNIPAPMRLALSMLLRQKYGVTLDEVIADPTKAIPIVTDIMNTLNTLNQKKAEAQKEGKPFNPYDPTLFVRS